MANPKIVVEVSEIGAKAAADDIRDLKFRVRELAREEERLKDRLAKTNKTLRSSAGAVGRLEDKLRGAVKQTKTFPQDFTRALRVLEGPLGGVAGRMQSLLVLLRDAKLGTVLLVGALVALVATTLALGVAMFKTTLRLDALDSQFLAATGSSTKAASALAFVEDISERLGLKFRDTASQFALFTASMKGSGLEGVGTRRIFEGLSVAIAGLNLGTDKAGRIFTAFQQIASKGKVSMEEISTQLAESLPGAMEKASRAMGLGKEAFIALVSSGKLLSDDLLPKLAEVLINDFASAAEKASIKLRAELNRLGNTFDDTLKIINKSTASGVAFADAVRFMNKTLKEFNNAMGRTIGLVTQISKNFKNLDLVSTETSLGLRIIATGFQFLGASASGVVDILKVLFSNLERIAGVEPLKTGPLEVGISVPFRRPSPGEGAFLDALKEQNEFRKIADDIIKEGLSIREVAARKQEQFNFLLEIGVLKTDQFREATDRLNRELLASNPLVQTLSKTFDSMADSMVTAALAGESAFDAFKVSLASALKQMTIDLLKFAIKTIVVKFALNALTGGFGSTIQSGAQSLLGAFQSVSSSPLTKSAKGNSFSNGARALQKGGLINSPTLFTSREGLNLAGEAGTEAVLPLQRDSQGRLGVSANITGGGGGGDTFVIDARGADPGQLQNLMELIRQLNGSIEERAIAASAEDITRRPRAFGTT